jgi:glucokinase
MNYAIGVDLGGTNLRAAVVDESGQMLSRCELSAEVGRGREHVVNDLCGAVERLREQMRAQAPEARLLGIGAGVPGLMDSETGRLVASPNLPGWSDYDVRGEIERRLGTTVILENDANAAAVGEQWLGAAAGVESMCMYTLGTGVGGGIILNGRPWRGWNGMAGELGHSCVEPNGHACGCGSHGCLEQYASATAVVRMAGEALATGVDSEMSEVEESEAKTLDARAVYECAMHGDGPARLVYARVGRALGMALAAEVNSMNLPIYVIGGGVSSGWDAFAPSMFAELRLRSYIYANTTNADGTGTGGRRHFTRIVRAKLGGAAGLFGAARLAILNGRT